MQVQQPMYSGAGTGSGGAVPIVPNDRGPSATRVQVTLATTGTVAFEEQIDGNWVPVLATNQATGIASPFAVSSGVYLIDSTGSGGIRAYPTVNATGCVITGTTVPGTSAAFALGSVLVPDVVKTLNIALATTVTIWTPAAGKRFRLMRFKIDATANISNAAPAVAGVNFLDNGVSMIDKAARLNVPAAAGTGVQGFSSGWVDLGRGVLSAAVNNALQVQLTLALTTGEVAVIVAGREE